METVEAAKTSPALTYVVWAQSVLHIILPELVLEMGPPGLAIMINFARLHRIVMWLGLSL